MIFTVNFVDWPQSQLNSSRSVSSPLWKNTMGLLDILRKNEISATFFIQTKVATRFPSLIKIIQLEGHEIACFIDNFENSDQSKRAIRYAIHTLKDIAGAKIIGTRCPALSLLESNFNEYCHLLNEMGIKYDSSLTIKHPLNTYINKNISLKAFENYKISQYSLPSFLSKPKLSMSKSVSMMKDIPSSFGGKSFKFLPYELTHFLARSLDKDKTVFSLSLSELEIELTPNTINTAEPATKSYTKKSISRKLEKLFSDYPFNSFKKKYY